MPWEEAQTVAFTRIEIAARVPSDPGVYAVMDHDQYLFVSDTWNLKARLLDLVNLLDGERQLTIRYETCEDHEREVRKSAIMQALGVTGEGRSAGRILPGLSLRDNAFRSA